MEVVREVNTDMIMYDSMKVAQFDIQKLPFVIFIGKKDLRAAIENFYLLNIKTCSQPQLLVKAKTDRQGIITSSEQDSFDFHFTHITTDDDKSEYEIHNRVCFRSDLIRFLEQNG